MTDRDASDGSGRGTADPTVRSERRGGHVRLTLRGPTDRELREVLVGLLSRLGPDDRLDHVRELFRYETGPAAWLSPLARAIRDGPEGESAIDVDRSRRGEGTRGRRMPGECAAAAGGGAAGKAGAMGRRVATVVLVLGLGTAAFWHLAGAAPSSPLATPAATPLACPVTRPNGVRPPPGAHVFGRGAGDFGNGAFWTALWIWGEGEVLVDPDHVRPDGSLGPMKWAWYRSVPGPLTVEGRRLDAPAPPLEAHGAGGASLAPPAATPAGAAVRYQDEAFLPTGLVFPSEGCWEVTGRVGEESLTFVVLVRLTDPLATPTAAAALRHRVTVREGSGPLPTGCTSEGVADLVADFLDAFNRGDRAALAAFFPAEAAPRGSVEPGKFQWFSVPHPDGGFTAYSRDELLAYLAGRHAHHEQLRLLRLEVGRSWHPGVDVVYDIARQADDVPPHVAGGKGAVMCQERTIFVWSMGDREALPDPAAAA